MRVENGCRESETKHKRQEYDRREAPSEHRSDQETEDREFYHPKHPPCFELFAMQLTVQLRLSEPASLARRGGEPLNRDGPVSAVAGGEMMH